MDTIPVGKELDLSKAVFYICGEKILQFFWKSCNFFCLVRSESRLYSSLLLI